MSGEKVSKPLAFGDRVRAKYRGDGTIISPSWEMAQKPHFNDDFCVLWDSGIVDWHGPAVLSRVVS